MRPASSHRPRSAFTLIEVMFATFLLTIVGMAIVGFLTAFASGSEARQRISDPAIESTLATRRLASLAPGFCCTLTADGEHALIWLSDTVPSRTVHLSEAGLVRFDETNRELVFETVDPAALVADLTLESEYFEAQYPQLLSTFDSLRGESKLLRHILAEGIDSATLSAISGAPGRASLIVSAGGASAEVTLAPTLVEEPLR